MQELGKRGGSAVKGETHNQNKCKSCRMHIYSPKKYIEVVNVQKTWEFIGSGNTATGSFKERQLGATRT